MHIRLSTASGTGWHASNNTSTQATPTIAHDTEAGVHLCDAVAVRAVGFSVLDKVGVVEVQAVVAKVHALLLPLDHPVAVVVQQEHHQVQLQAQ